MNSLAVDINKSSLTSLSSNFLPFTPQNSFLPSQQATPFSAKSFEPNSGRFSPDSFHPHHTSFPQQNFPFYPYQQEVMYDPFLAKRYTYLNEKIPRASNYKSDSTIAEAFPHLKEINNPSFTLDDITPDAKFFFMRSSNDDDIHKSIKYERWSSTAPCNQKLEKAYTQYKETRPDEEPQIFFVYSVVNTKNLLGIARMASNYSLDATFTYWLESDKYKGSYKLQWLFIKDVPLGKIDDQTDEEFNLKNLKDGAELTLEQGKQVFQSFLKQDPRPNIFDTFEYMDRREDLIRHMRDNEMFTMHSPIFRRPFRKFNPSGKMYHYNKFNHYENRGYGNGNNYSNGNANGNANGTGNGYHHANGYARNFQNRTDRTEGFRPRNYEHTNQNNKSPDIASVFIVRDSKEKQQHKRNKNQNGKKRNNESGNGSVGNGHGPQKQSKIDEEFWNQRPKMVQNMPESDEEELEEKANVNREISQ